MVRYLFLILDRGSMKKYLIIVLLMFFAGNATMAQLVRLPENISRVLSREVMDQLDAVVDSTKQFSFEILIQVTSVTKDSTHVVSIQQHDMGKPVKYLTNILFINELNFATLLNDKKKLTIHIPCFYSVINRVSKTWSGKNGYADFFDHFNALFVKSQVSEDEIYTSPITVFGATYE